MNGHPVILADAGRLKAFSLLGRPRRLFHDSDVWVDEDGIPWAAVRGSSITLALSTLGPGWVFDPEAREERSAEYAQRRQAVNHADMEQHRKELKQQIQDLQLGGHAERLLWAIHRAVWVIKKSSLTLADTYLAQAVWGRNRCVWPRHWRKDMDAYLRSLAWLHVADDGGEHPHLGRSTVLLTHIGDLRGTEQNQCPEECVERGGARHHHYQIEIGHGFLGVLEQFARVEEDGVRTYAFPVAGPKKSPKPTLRRAGRTGRLVSVFQPAVLPEPNTNVTLSPRQVELLQTLLRETTRLPVDERKTFGDVRVMYGRVVPDYQRRNEIRCPHLAETSQYVGMNGNRTRRGCGYRITSSGGWMAKAGYSTDELDRFLGDLALMGKKLGIIVVGLRQKTWYTLKDLQALMLTRVGRNVLDRVHLRVYTGADYLDRWSVVFGWQTSPTFGDQAVAASSEATLKRARIFKDSCLSKRKFAEAMGCNEAFIRQVINAKRPCPVKLLEKAAAWATSRNDIKAAAKGGGLDDPVAACEAREPPSVFGVAKDYLARGWCVVPQATGAKMPCVKWKPYQEARPTLSQLEEWWSEWPDAGIALILGPVSDLFVIDVDGEEAHDALIKHLGSEPMAPKANSGSGKPYRYHLFFRHPALETKAKATPWHPHLEFRGHRGIIIAPPSLHKSGNRYSWALGRSPDEMALPDVPAPVVESLKPTPRPKPALVPASELKHVVGVDASPRTLEFLSGKIANGPRWNDRLFSAACDLCGRDIPLEQAEPLLLAGAAPWNVGEEELARRTIVSAYSKFRVPGER